MSQSDEDNTNTVTFKMKI